ncbi:MAG TPA: RNA polymerase sigma factor [Trebonia sp.]
MARAGSDYPTADTQVAETNSTAATAEPATASSTTKAKTGKARTAPKTGGAKKPAAKKTGAGTRSRSVGVKTTARLKTAGRKTAAKIKAATPGSTGHPDGDATAVDNAATHHEQVAVSAVAADTGLAPDDEQEMDELTKVVHGARAGDSECFRILYREVQPKLLRYLSFLVDNTDAEDIASETWLQATRDFHKFEGDIDNFRGWITTIARHRAMDHLRKSSRQPPAVPMPVEEFSFFASADDTEARAIETITTDDAVKLISTLPKDQAEAVMLRAVIGMDARTAAAVVGKRAGAVRTAAYRGLKTLAKRLGVEGG